MNGFTLHRGSGGVELRLGASCGEAQRSLGPVAFNALVTIALNASRDNGGHWIAHASARAIAEDLDIGKERAAAALRVLRDRGFLVPRESRSSDNARFAPSVYELRIDSPEPRRPAHSATIAKPGHAPRRDRAVGSDRVRVDNDRDQRDLRLFGDA